MTTAMPTILFSVWLMVCGGVSHSVSAGGCGGHAIRSVGVRNVVPRALTAVSADWGMGLWQYR